MSKKFVEAYEWDRNEKLFKPLNYYVAVTEITTIEKKLFRDTCVTKVVNGSQTTEVRATKDFRKIWVRDYVLDRDVDSGNSYGYIKETEAYITDADYKDIIS